MQKWYSFDGSELNLKFFTFACIRHKEVGIILKLKEPLQKKLHFLIDQKNGIVTTRFIGSFKKLQNVTFVDLIRTKEV